MHEVFNGNWRRPVSTLVCGPGWAWGCACGRCVPDAKPRNGARLRAALASFFGKANAVHGNRLSTRCNTSELLRLSHVTIHVVSMSLPGPGTLYAITLYLYTIRLYSLQPYVVYCIEECMTLLTGVDHWEANKECRHHRKSIVLGLLPITCWTLLLHDYPRLGSRVTPILRASGRGW